MQRLPIAACQSHRGVKPKKKLLVVTALFVALAAVALWKLSAAPTGRSIAGEERGQAIAAGRNYYADIAHFLRTGDPVALQATLAPEFVDHLPWPGFAGDQAGYQASLAALRQALLPGPTVTAVMVGLEHGLATYHVTIATSPGVTLPTRSGVAPQRDWRYSERIRIRSGQIVDRWGPELPFALTESQTSWQGSVPVDGQPLFVSSWTSADGMKVYLGKVAIVVLEGVATVEPAYKLQVVRNNSELIEREVGKREMTVGPGDIVISSYVVTVTSEGPAHLLILRFNESNPWLAQPSNLPAFSSAIEVTAGALADSIGAIDGVLPAGATLQQIFAQRMVLGTGTAFDGADQGKLRIIQVSEGELFDSGSSRVLVSGSIAVISSDGTALQAVAPTVAWEINIDIS